MLAIWLRQFDRNGLLFVDVYLHRFQVSYLLSERRSLKIFNHVNYRGILLWSLKCDSS